YATDGDAGHETVEIDEPLGRDDAPPVQQNEGRSRAESAQIDGACVVAIGATLGEILYTTRTTDVLRNVAQKVSDIEDAGLRKLFLIDADDGCGDVLLTTANQRARDHHLLQLIGASFRILRRAFLRNDSG